MRRLLAAATTVAAAALGAWLLAARAPAPPPPSCDDEAACAPATPAPLASVVASAAPAVRGSPRPSASVTPAAATPGAAPTSAADGVALRAEADRLIAAGKVMEGIAVFRKAVAAAPTAENHGDLGSLLYRLTAFDEAAVNLRAAAERDPGNADRWIALANAYYRKVDPGEAWKAEKRAREAEPGLVLGRDADGMRVRK
jgi:tetratricopeptide (TPR) repeat protein